MLRHGIWILLTAAVILWYSTVTVYVAIRGIRDIKGMLQRLGRQRESNKS